MRDTFSVWNFGLEILVTKHAIKRQEQESRRGNEIPMEKDKDISILIIASAEMKCHKLDITYFQY